MPEAPGGAAQSADWLAREAIRLLIAAGQTVAVAESLTGGLVAAALTSVPGSSAVFRGGIVAYATELKTALLGVPAELLARHGPVHAEVAAAMAAGVRASARSLLRAGHDRSRRAWSGRREAAGHGVHRGAVAVWPCRLSAEPGRRPAAGPDMARFAESCRCWSATLREDQL